MANISKIQLRQNGDIYNIKDAEARTLLNGHSVGIDVPSNAVFTDTWISNTASRAGYVASPNNASGRVWGTNINGSPQWLNGMVYCGIAQNQSRDFNQFNSDTMGVGKWFSTNGESMSNAPSSTVSDYSWGMLFIFQYGVFLQSHDHFYIRSYLGTENARVWGQWIDTTAMTFDVDTNLTFSNNKLSVVNSPTFTGSITSNNKTGLILQWAGTEYGQITFGTYSKDLNNYHSENQIMGALKFRSPVLEYANASSSGSGDDTVSGGGSVSSVGTSQFYFKQYSSNDNAQKLNNNDNFEVYWLPACTQNMTGREDYNIITTKNYSDIGLAQPTSDFVGNGINSGRSGLMSANDKRKLNKLIPNTGNVNGSFTRNIVSKNGDNSIPNDNTFAELATFSLTPGDWIVNIAIRWAVNGIGQRFSIVSDSSSSVTPISGTARDGAKAVSNGYTVNKLVLFMHVSNSTTYYIKGKQNSDGSLATSTQINKWQITA